MTNYPLLCNVNDTKRLRREALKNGQWHETSLNNTMTPDGELTDQPISHTTESSSSHN